jgi:hypothetical protein
MILTTSERLYVIYHLYVVQEVSAYPHVTCVMLLQYVTTFMQSYPICFLFYLNAVYSLLCYV